MPEFRLDAPFQPTGDQPQAIARLTEGLAKGMKHQVLLGATGTGKTWTIANVIRDAGKPTLVLAHNKTLAAQLYSEFREFFPDNAVEYFVSYFDYYQPEAYLPRSDTYIEKDSSRNDEIDKLRHAATRALFERKDVIIVASVSCIYGLGAPVDYGATVLRLRTGGRYRRDGVLRQLVDLQYQRNDQALTRAKFRVRGDTLELQPAYDDFLVRVQFFGDEVERITELDPLTGELLAERAELNVYPASHYVTPQDKLKEALVDIEAEAEQRVTELEARGMVLEAERLRQRTTFDVEMMRELGFCSGIENYSRHLSRREAGSRPWTLLDYFPADWLLVVDESHMTIPQVVGMYKNDRTRKEILVDFGFRLPSALDNRPLTFEEFEVHLDQVIHMSATPSAYELQRADQVVQQLIRPTGIVDPKIEIKPTEGQIDDLIDRVKDRVALGERVLVTTLTKKMAEDLADYLHEMGVKVSYLHSEVDTLERVQILRDLRLGVYDVLVGINLLREGIDLPEVTLVAILDADKEGFLRSAWSLIQVIGRAARNTAGEVVMYADRVTESMQVAIDETNRRRAIQEAYNKEHGIVPQTIVKEIRDINDRLKAVGASPGARDPGGDLSELSKEKVDKLVAQLEAEMKAAAKQLEFERAAAIRDEIQDIRLRVLDQDASTQVLKAAERAAAGGRAGRTDARAKPSERMAALKDGGRGARGESLLEVTEVTVLAAGEEPLTAVPLPAEGGHDHDGHGHGEAEPDAGTAADLYPGLRDAHEGDDEGWMARWLDKPTWDRRVTPNVVKRTGAPAPAARMRAAPATAGEATWFATPPGVDDGLTGFTGLVADLIVAFGELGVLLLVFIETVIPPIPSELVLTLAGWQSQVGRMSLPLTIAAATLGATLGSLVLYWLGARFGEARAALTLMARLPLVEEEDLARASAAFRRYGPAVVFFGRFLPIVRSLVSLPAGAQHMPVARFVLLTQAAGSAIWNTILVGGGYLLGTQHERLEAILGYLDYVVLGALALGVGWLSIRHVRRRRLEPQPVAPDPGEPSGD